jgi:hypothetical protein
MSKQPRDEQRERRIENEVIVDAYGPEEQAMGWYYYLEDTLGFPFRARCVSERVISPLRMGEEVEVARMASEGDCEREMFVVIRWSGRNLGVPLSQLAPVATDDATQRAAGDWHYWVDQGYTF